MAAPEQIVAQREAQSGIMPDAAMAIIFDQATSVAGSREGGLGFAAILGMILAIYSASKGMSSLMEGMNVTYDEEEKRSFIRLKPETLAGVVILLMWLWISAYVIMQGAKMDVEMEAQTTHNTTVGQDQSMGHRDAQEADRLGAAQDA